jgi:fructokinase
LRQQFYSKAIIEASLKLVKVLKLNDTELPVLATLFNLGGEPRMQIGELAQRFGLDVVALTRGAQGSLLYQSGRWSEAAGRVVQVVDTVGAGDSFTAALALGLLHDLDLDDINAFANEVASHVCTCAGATPPLPEKLRNRFPTGH